MNILVEDWEANTNAKKFKRWFWNRRIARKVLLESELLELKADPDRMQKVLLLTSWIKEEAM